MDRTACLPTFDQLRQHVREVLCEHDQFDVEQTPLFQGVLTRSSRPCGLYFQVQGPRLVRTSAIWAGEEGRILFYDAQGRRFGQTRLSEGPDPLQLRAAGA